MINRIIQAVLWAIFRFVNWGRGPRPVPSTVRNVLLVSTTGLGDTVISTAAMHLARQVWPRARFHALLHQRWAALLAGDPDWDGVIIYPGKFKKVISLIRRLRNLDLDVAVILHANDPDIVPLCRLARIKYLVGSDRSRFSFLLDVSVNNPDPNRHIAERRMDLLRAIAGPLLSVAPRISIPKERLQWAESFWADLGVKPETRLMVLNPGGSRQPKRWPLDNWIELIRHFHQIPNLSPALFGSPAERTTLLELARRCGDPQPLMITLPDIMEAAALLCRASAFVGPDSGLSHLAATLGIPAVIFFGPDNPVLSRPYLTPSPLTVLISEKNVCPDIAACHKKVCRPNRCVEALTPDMVLSALYQVWNIGSDQARVNDRLFGAGLLLNLNDNKL